MAELGYKPTLYILFQAFTCGNQEASQKYPGILQDAYGAEVTYDDKDPKFQAFKRRLEEKGEVSNVIGSAMMYDSVMEMAQAYQGCDSKECALNKLRNLDYQGITGRIRYNGGQIVQREVMITKYENGKWVEA